MNSPSSTALDPAVAANAPLGYRFCTHTRPAMVQMAELLAAERAPSNIVRRVATEDRKRGDHASCLCGSGATFPLCHGRRNTGRGAVEAAR